MNFLESLRDLLVTLPIVLIALTFHEFAHGFAAYKLGDNTAKRMGRLTLNPIKHLDPLGAICMLVAHFGWAKPVPIDIINFKNPKRDLAISALAGPLANMIIAFFGCFLYVLTIELLPTYEHEFSSQFTLTLAKLLIQFVFLFAWLNISLALFNLLPIPPLDGSKILYAFLPPQASNWCKFRERQIALVFMLVIILDTRYLGGFLTGFLSAGVTGIFTLFTDLFKLMF